MSDPSHLSTTIHSSFSINRERVSIMKQNASARNIRTFVNQRWFVFPTFSGCSTRPSIPEPLGYLVRNSSGTQTRVTTRKRHVATVSCPFHLKTDKIAIFRSSAFLLLFSNRYNNHSCFSSCGRILQQIRMLPKDNPSFLRCLRFFWTYQNLQREHNFY